VTDLSTWLWISLGGFAGAVTRYLLSCVLNQWGTYRFAYSTLTVNVLGCVTMGWLAGHTNFELWQWGLGVGFLGSLTTFSTVMLETIRMMEQHTGMKSIIYLVMTYVLCIGCVGVGYYV
jgi:CrcB protein